MKNKLSLLLLLFLICILSISAISAADNTTNKDVISIDNNEDNCELNLEQNNNDELKEGGELNFNDLNAIINGNSNSTIYLSSNYKYDEESDSDFVNGIIIDRDLTIYGNGITLNGNKMARIFNVIDFNLNVAFYNISFIKGHSSNGCGGAIHGGIAYNCNFNDNYAYDGGALCSGTAYNCTFKDNEAKHNGGAIFDGNAYNCTFTENEAVTGGAMSDSDAYNSTFTENEADNGGAMYGGVAFNSTFTKNEAEHGGAMYESVADECFFKKNHADDGGGAMYKGEAFYCDFVSNSARDDGGAMYRGNAYACTFTENEAAYIDERYGVYEYYNGGAIYDGNAYNCTFIENFAGDGGAMYDGSAHNCIFKENKAQHNGGAIADGDAYYCTFTKNIMYNEYGGGMYNGNAYHCIFQKNSEGECARAGGAMAYSNAYNCTFKDNWGQYEAMFIGKAALCKFNGDSTDGVDIIHPAIYVSDYVSTYNSGEKLEFDLVADSILLDGFNITIEIYKDNQLYTTVYGLSGEGWIVDLEPGEYTAGLRPTDFPKEKSSIATITVRSTFADLNTTINGNNNSTIYLSNNDYFKFDIASDVELIYGININRDLTIYGNGTTINGDAIARIFKVEDNVNVKFYNINFINGKAVDGGAIYGGNAYNCFFRDNTAERDGGAIYGGNAFDCTFNFNAAERDGGAIYLGNATDCTFNINTAEKDGGAITQGNAYNSTFIQNHADNLGGAIHLGNAAGCTFTSNTAGTGGAISQGNVYNSTFILNRADNVGGAIYLGNATDCTFTNSTAETGGVMYGGNAKNCTFTKNKAYAFGGAIYGGNVIDCTFAKNKADRGGAIYQGNANNCTFTDNTAEKDGGAIFKGDAINCTFIGNTAHHGGAMICEDINRNYTAEGCTFIGNSADGGGATYFVDVFNCIFTNNTSTCDGGAVYKRAAVNCTFTGNTAERDGGAIFKGDAINCTFIGNTAHHGGAMNCEDINRNYTADGCTFIGNSADGGGATYGVDVFNCIFTNNTSTCDGGAVYYRAAVNCTFTGNTAERDGGAIFKGDAINCTFIDNTAKHHGGAIYFGDGKFTAVNCTFIGNSADGGGATYGVDVFNCIFTNNTSTCDGGAVYYRAAVNCTFTGNTAERDGGAIFKGDAINCTFIGNSAQHHGGAMYEGTACLCIFNEDSTKDTKIIHAIINVLNYASTYKSGEKLKFNLTANDMVFDGFKTTIAIYKNGSLVKTAYALTGEGWIVDLGPGEYTAVLSLTDYSGEGSSNATINVLKGNTTIDISPISNVKVGQEVMINYTTNSNGTVTIKVNGQKISGNKFTPTKVGIYNVTVEVAGNDYYAAASNETSFTAEKTAAVVVISPVADVVVGQEVTINYDTNSNGTVSIKVNGQKITGNKFTPTKVGIYNVTVEVAENDYYTVASNETSFTVKTAAVVVISPVADVVVGQEVTINYDTNSNGTVTIKVNGQKITGNKFTPTKVGIYNVTVEVGENDYYSEASNETSFNVEKIDTILTVEDVRTVYNTARFVVATLTDVNGTVLTNIKVKIVVGNLTKIAKTDENGQVSLDITTLEPGEYAIRTRSSGVNEIYSESKAFAHATVYPEKLNTTLTIPDVYVIGNSSGVVVATLKDSYGNAVSGVNVKIVVGSLTVTAKTDANGQVSLDISGLAPGEYKISARSSGTSEIYKEAKAYAKVIVSEEKLDTTLTVPDVVVDGSSSAVVVATLKDSYKNLVSGVKVKITVGDLTKTAKTNAKGQVSLDISGLAPGNYKISARSSGTSEIYNEAKATAKATVYAN